MKGEREAELEAVLVTTRETKCQNAEQYLKGGAHFSPMPAIPSPSLGAILTRGREILSVQIGREILSAHIGEMKVGVTISTQTGNGP